MSQIFLVMENGMESWKSHGKVMEKSLNFIPNFQYEPWYTSPVFHDCLPAYLSKDIESIQRRAMRISFPSPSYKEALDEAGLISLSVRRQSLTDKLFTKVTTDRENKLHHLLPEKRTCHYNLRKQRRFKPVFKTNRCKSSFIIHNSQKLFS